MPTTFEIRDQNYLLAHSEEIESGTRFDGIYHDGLYYWVVGTAAPYPIRQYYFNGTSIELVQSITPTITLNANQTFDGIRCITGDGKNLFVLILITTTIEGPPGAITQNWHLRALDRNGTQIADLFSFSGLLGSPYDLSYDGKHVLLTYQQNSVPTQFRFRFVMKTDQGVSRSGNPTATADRRDAHAFDGARFKTGRLASGTIRGRTEDYDFADVQAEVDIGVGGTGFDFYNCDSDFAEFFTLGAEMPGPYIYNVRQ